MPFRGGGRQVILPWNFSQPENMRRHNQQVADGEYAPTTLPDNWAPVVLDIGACCGAFAFWVKRLLPRTAVVSYEPNNVAFEHLVRNWQNFEPAAHVEHKPQNVGVRAYAGLYKLNQGKNNLGEASMNLLGEQEAGEQIAVECIAASDLPDCDWLKVDTEGCEVEIIESYLESRSRGNLPRIISFEFHRADDFGRLYEQLTANWESTDGWKLNRADIHRHDRGTCVFVRES